MRVTRLLKCASFEILSSVPGRHICRKSRRHVGRRATTPSASCRAPFPTPGNQSGNRLCSLSFLKNLLRNPVWNRMAPMFLRTGELPPKHFIIIFHQLRHLQIHGIFATASLLQRNLFGSLMQIHLLQIWKNQESRTRWYWLMSRKN